MSSRWSQTKTLYTRLIVYTSRAPFKQLNIYMYACMTWSNLLVIDLPTQIVLHNFSDWRKTYHVPVVKIH